LGRYRQNFADHFSHYINPDRSRISLLFFSALYHDIAKTELSSITEEGKTRYPDHEETGARTAKNRAANLHLSNKETQTIWSIIHHHGWIRKYAREKNEITATDAYRFFTSAEDTGVDVILLSIADLVATYGTFLPQDKITDHIAVCRALLEFYWETPERINPPDLVDGRVLMRKLRIMPGPIIGKMLEEIKEAQVMEVISTQEEAISLAKEILNSNL
jgi:poly(A) polymerase